MCDMYDILCTCILVFFVKKKATLSTQNCDVIEFPPLHLFRVRLEQMLHLIIFIPTENNITIFISNIINS